MNKFKKSDYLYTRLFCEENIWQLAKSLINQGVNNQDINIIFISNKNKQIAIFNQLTAEVNQPAIWDYHVILMINISQSPYILDFDTRLFFSSRLEDYFKNSFPDIINPEYQSHYRVIPATYYLEYFYSDRSHMKNIISSQEFPPYPCLCPKTKERLLLCDLININKNIKNTFLIQNCKQFLDWSLNQSLSIR